jgi:hypothetical protein
MRMEVDVEGSGSRQMDFDSTIEPFRSAARV